MQREETQPGSAGWAPATRAYWLERFYDLVFVACVGRFANELGAVPDAVHAIVVLAWLTGLWLSWFLVITRLNRFPDERVATRAALLVQLLALTVAAAAAVSITAVDDVVGVVAVAGMAAGIALLYVTIPREAGADARLVRAQVVGNLAVAGAVLSILVLPTGVGVAVSGAVAAVWFVVVLVWYLPRVARVRPVDPKHAGDRYGQLFLVLMGLSFLKIAFEPDPNGGVSVPTVVGGFAVGFALWSLYVDGVLPFGFPSQVRQQRRWLVSQLALAVGVTVAAAAVVAVPPTEQGTVALTQAVLEGGAVVVVLLSFASIALNSQQPRRRAAATRGIAAVLVALVSSVAAVTGTMADVTFSLILAGIIIASAIVDVAARRATLVPRP